MLHSCCRKRRGNVKVEMEGCWGEVIFCVPRKKGEKDGTKGNEPRSLSLWRILRGRNEKGTQSLSFTENQTNFMKAREGAPQFPMSLE